MLIEHVAGIALLQDMGRHHLVPAGVPRSGPMDPLAHLTALRLVGNPVDAPTIEFVGRWRFRLAGAGPAVIAACGDIGITIAGAAQPAWTALECPVGAPVELVGTGGFGYLSVAGAPLARKVLGASATCVLGGIGPEPLRSGGRLELAPAGAVSRGLVGSFARAPRPRGPVRLIPGPHGRPPAARVTVVSVDRIGVRVAPLGPRRTGATAQLPSLGVIPGAIQMLPSGDLVILGPDAGTMGGYPVVGVLAGADLWRLGRVRVGEELRLAEVAPDAARESPWPVIVRPIA
jgi:allophanate hydrolase subunit 2